MYFTIIFFNNDRSTYGVILDNGITTFKSLQHKGEVSFKGEWNNLFNLAAAYIGFYDYSNNTVGVCDLNKGALLWEKKLNARNYLYIGSELNNKCNGVVVQSGCGDVSIFDLDGSVVSSFKETREILALGNKWSFLNDCKHYILSGDGYVKFYTRTNSIRSVVRNKNYLLVNEWQGPFRVIDICNGHVAFEVYPNKGFQFVDGCLSHDFNNCILTSHRMGESIGVCVQHYKFSSTKCSECNDEVFIKMGGGHHLFSEGSRIIFNTGDIFDAITGEQIYH